MADERVVYVGSKLTVSDYGLERFQVLEERIVQYCPYHDGQSKWGRMWENSYNVGDPDYVYPSYTVDGGQGETWKVEG